jgi:hypothetical protein
LSQFFTGRKAIKRPTWVRGGMVCLESTSAQDEKITEPAANYLYFRNGVLDSIQN